MNDREALRKIRERLRDEEDGKKRRDGYDPRQIEEEPIPPEDVVETSRSVLYGYPELGAKDKIIYIKFQDLARKGVREEVTEEELAKVMGVGIRTFKRALARLIEAKLVSVEKWGRTNNYKVKPGNTQDTT